MAASENTDNTQRDMIMEVKDLKKWFPVNANALIGTKKFVKAVDGVSLKIERGTTLGIVGESGCGKSTLARLLLHLVEPTSGEIIFDNQNISKISNISMRKVRRDIQMIFQDPYASLNPRMKVMDTLVEPFMIHKLMSHKEAEKKAVELLDLVGMNVDSLKKYPHEFSGGQRQRICIARALSVQPKMIICDECVSALDVSIQAQIINLLVKLQKQLGLTLIFISHDLKIVRHISSQIAVMYLGKIVESASKEELFQNPLHPYTKALLSAVPIPNPEQKKNRIVLTGDLPSPIDLPTGCTFHTRCYCANETCSRNEQTLRDLGNGHFCLCQEVRMIEDKPHE